MRVSQRPQAQERRNGSWMILLRRGFARLLHHAAEIVEAEPGGSLLGNGLVLPLIDFRAPALGIGIAGRELERLIEVGFGVGEFIQAKEGPASPRIGLGVVRINLDSKADIDDRTALTALVVDDPKRTRAGRFCCDARARPAMLAISGVGEAHASSSTCL